MLIEYPTSDYIRILYDILLFARNVINLPRISANKVIKGGVATQSFQRLFAARFGKKAYLAQSEV